MITAPVNTPSPDPHALRLRGVEVRLGADAPLFAVPELNLPVGGRLAVLGPSGCGKSTLLSLAGGVLRADRGEIRVHGLDLQTLAPAELDRHRGQHIGFVFQTFNLLDSFSAEENIRLGLAFSRRIPAAEHAERARSLLDQVGLAHRAHARPGQLSIGERQRVAIARAVAARPSLLLADEPTGSLDPATARQVHTLILELSAQSGCALLYVTHDSGLAADFPDRFDATHLLRRDAEPPAP
jgi:putative ABC transport system ATP-binding protein